MVETKTMSWLLETHQIKLGDTVGSDVKAGLSCWCVTRTPQSSMAVELGSGQGSLGMEEGKPAILLGWTPTGLLSSMDERADLEAHVFRN